ncbi:MAG TPA: hypothetical protein VGZ22_13300 [Isosphaeraceae bacterium]|nr:hypothetical protein [Isosphaeraceae bacterium]
MGISFVPTQEVKRARKPAGGYQLIPVLSLAMAWWAYRQQLIRIADLRVWFAGHEMLARRCLAAKDVPCCFGLHELQKLTGLAPRRLNESLRRLQAAGLMSFSETAIAFATSPDVLAEEDLEGFWQFLDQIPNPNRQVPLPRRMLRLLCSGARPVLIATILGHLLRCLYLRKGQCESRGRVKASWIAHAFAVSLRRVKQARQDLITMGWLIPLDADQWALNRWGAHVQVNLAWSRSPAEPSAICRQPAAPLPLCGKMAPPARSSRVKPTPPESDTCSPTGRERNQKPAPGRPTGVRSSQLGPKVPGEPQLRHVVPQDLKDTTRLLALYDQAVTHCLVDRSERDRLRFLAAAEHARVIGTRNPCGLFVRLIRSNLWHFVTQEDEEAANARLKRHLFSHGAGPRGVSSLLPRHNEKPSEDARLVRAIRGTVACAGYRGDAFPFLKRQRPEWTRERWDMALTELRAIWPLSSWQTT